MFCSWGRYGQAPWASDACFSGEEGVPTSVLIKRLGMPPKALQRQLDNLIKALGFQRTSHNQEGGKAAEYRYKVKRLRTPRSGGRGGGGYSRAEMCA